MAYNPQADFTNWEAPSGNFTQGNVKDNDGTRNGTPINQKTLNDLYQFYLRLLAKNGVSPNNQPDNQVDNQIMEALDKNLREWEPQDTTKPSLDGVSPGYARFELSTMTAEIELPSSTTDEVVTFSVAPHPVGSTITCYVVPGSGAFSITVNSTNIGLNRPIYQAGVNGTDQSTRRAIDFTNGDSFTITVFDDYLLLNQPQV